jgi:hypothetical protein
MVWAGISAQGKTDPNIIKNGTLTAVTFVNEMLDVHVRKNAGAVGPDFIFMDGNARAHRANITKRYLEEATIVRTDWTARTPDLNQLEHLGYRTENHFFTPRSTNNSSGGKTGNHRGMDPDFSSQGPQARGDARPVINARGHHNSVSNTLRQPFPDFQDFFIPLCDLQNVDFRPAHSFRNMHTSRNTSIVIIFIKINS